MNQAYGASGKSQHMPCTLISIVKIFTVFIFISALAVRAQDVDTNALNLESRQFGRVFTTQDQRLKLNQLRADGLLDNEYTHTEVQATINNDSNNQMRFSGFVLSEGGKNTVWVNGKSKLTPNASSSDAKVSRPSKVTQAAEIISENKSAIVKPGQVWLLNSNEVKEGYEIKPEPRDTENTVSANATKEKTNVDAAIETMQTLQKLNSR